MDNTYRTCNNSIFYTFLTYKEIINSVEWIIADWAIMLAGMISIPVYPTANTQTLKFIVSRTNCKRNIYRQMTRNIFEEYT